ncbi:hypothetical protein SSBG_05458 [Streptomyces sp. SPB074]|nr:hypothetical protein SSBG_05458 [Streptomyces sp. SPB074]
MRTTMEGPPAGETLESLWRRKLSRDAEHHPPHPARIFCRAGNSPRPTAIGPDIRAHTSTHRDTPRTRGQMARTRRIHPAGASRAGRTGSGGGSFPWRVFSTGRRNRRSVAWRRASRSTTTCRPSGRGASC